MRDRRSPVVAVIVLALAFSGCVADKTPAKDEVAEVPDFTYSDERFSIQSINATSRDWVPTLDAPPELVVGEYWTVRVTGALTGLDITVTMVVAGQEGDHWLIGMPTHDFSNDAMVMHLPGLGQVKKDTLGFEAHDVWFDPLRFPIVDGENWTTGFVTPDALTATVMSVEGLNATIEMTGNFHVVVEYDASIRGIRKMVIDNYGSYEVLEHGFDWHNAFPQWEGVVTVPHMADLVLCHGRMVVVVEVAMCKLGAVDQPTESVAIDSQYDRVSFSNLISSIQAPKATMYTLRTVAPDGTVYEDSLTGLDEAKAKMVSYKHDAPGGTWTIEAMAPGPGQVFAEGIGYHVYDVEIATGRILPSIGEHQHGSGEGH